MSSIRLRGEREKAEQKWLPGPHPHPAQHRPVPICRAGHRRESMSKRPATSRATSSHAMPRSEGEARWHSFGSNLYHAIGKDCCAPFSQSHALAAYRTRPAKGHQSWNIDCVGSVKQRVGRQARVNARGAVERQAEQLQCSVRRTILCATARAGSVEHHGSRRADPPGEVRTSHSKSPVRDTVYRSDCGDCVRVEP